MTKQELSRYFWLRHEIERQRRRLSRLQKKNEHAGEIVGDSVKDYRTGKGLPLKIEGYAQEDLATPVMIKMLETEIQRNIEESEKAAVEIERYIQQVEDAKLRELLRSRFLDCLSWGEVGRKNYINPDYARSLVNGFLKQI